MTHLRLATFNCENLFARFKFTKPPTQTTVQALATEGFYLDRSVFTRTTPAERALTAKAILATDADVIALVEVEGMDTLKAFNTAFLSKAGYRYQMCVDGNDPRCIDVAVLSRHPFGAIRSHQFRPARKKGSRVFSRDCLEIEIEVGKSRLPLFVNHFKSMLDKANPAEGRKSTTARRREQSEAVVAILAERFGTIGNATWAVVGDLNDYYDGDAPAPGLAPLLGAPGVVDLLARRPADDRWTYFFDRGKLTHQLDYVIVSEAVAAANAGAVPQIVRKGISTKAVAYAGPRFPEVTAKTVASDHCPIFVDLDI